MFFWSRGNRDMAKAIISYILGLITLPIFLVLHILFFIPILIPAGRILEIPLTPDVSIETETVEPSAFMTDPRRIGRLKHRNGETIVAANIHRYCFDHSGIEGFLNDPGGSLSLSTHYFNYSFGDESATVVEIDRGHGAPDMMGEGIHRPCDSERDCMAYIAYRTDIFKQNWQAQFNCRNKPG